MRTLLDRSLESWSKPGAEAAFTAASDAGRDAYGECFFANQPCFVVEGMATGQAGIEILNAPGWLANDSDRKEARCLS